MRKQKILWGAFAAGLICAAFLTAAGCSGETKPHGGGTDEGGEASSFAIAEAAYPQQAEYPNEEEFWDERTGEWDNEGFFAVYDAWREEKRALYSLPEADGKAIEGFSKNSIRQFLSQSDGKNRVYSPVNVYMALAMLAETTDGESRQQILDLLEAEDIEALRTHGENIWKLCYSDDGAVTSILANSLWLREGMAYKEDTLERLASQYYASSFRGEMGSPEYNRALQNWLDEQTGGLLREQAAKVELRPETVMALASTLYYRAKWNGEFFEENTKEGVFHSAAGDIPWDFMNRSGSANYYWAENFSAVPLYLNESGKMWLVLPDEGVEVDTLLAEEKVFALIQSEENWTDKKYLIVNLSLPKFDVVSDINLIDGLKALGVQDVFDGETADFSPLTEPAEGIFLSMAQHAARVKVDEKGVEAAAYTGMAAAGSGMPSGDEVDFILDRPFLFVITSRTGLPLFAGVVNQPGA